MAARRSFAWSASTDEPARRRLATRRAGIDTFVRLRRVSPHDPGHARFVAAFDALTAGTTTDDAAYLDAAEVALDRLGGRAAAEAFIDELTHQGVADTTPAPR